MTSRLRTEHISVRKKNSQASSKKYVSIGDQVDILKKHIQDQDKKIEKRIREQDKQFEISCKQFELTQDALKMQIEFMQQQATFIKRQDSEMAILRALLESQKTKIANAPSPWSNPFLRLSSEELQEKIILNQKRIDFFHLKGSITGPMFEETRQIVSFIAVNVISILAPGIIPADSVDKILQGNPQNYLSSILTANQFGQCYAPRCVQFIRKGMNANDPFLSFLHNTISYNKVFKNLRKNLRKNNILDQQASEELMRIICRYGLDRYKTSTITPKEFFDAEIANDYYEAISKKVFLAVASENKQQYSKSFGLWPFRKCISVAVDSHGYPGYYLTGLFINHFSNSDEVVKQLYINDQDEVELELTQLKEALKLKKRLIK